VVHLPSSHRLLKPTMSAPLPCPSASSGAGELSRASSRGKLSGAHQRQIQRESCWGGCCDGKGKGSGGGGSVREGGEEGGGKVGGEDDGDSGVKNGGGGKHKGGSGNCSGGG
jgi:hypothetical protein